VCSSDGEPRRLAPPTAVPNDGVVRLFRERRGRRGHRERLAEHLRGPGLVVKLAAG
jgi:hypothetical protein